MFSSIRLRSPLRIPPFDLILEQPSLPITRSGETLLQVKVNRHGDFKGPVELQCDWLPPGVSGGGTITAGKCEGEVRIQANAKAEAGILQIAINGSTQGADAF